MPNGQRGVAVHRAVPDGGTDVSPFMGVIDATVHEWNIEQNPSPLFRSLLARHLIQPGLRPLVTQGTGYVDPHCEQANSPFRPDAIWFSCTTPAAEGGETLYWDGVRLWGELGSEWQDLFRDKKLRFLQCYSKEMWQLFLGHDARADDIRKTLDGVEGVSYFLNADEALYLEYVCPAVVRTRYGNVEAFANSLMSEWTNTLGDLMTFDDGMPISEEIVSQVKAALDRCTETVDQKPGDLVFIDNSCFLHGRNGFTDPTRKIFSSLSFLNFSLRPDADGALPHWRTQSHRPPSISDFF